MNRLQLLHNYFRSLGFALLLLLMAQQSGFGQSNCFSLHMPLVSAQQFDTVILPVSVKGFNQIISTGLYFSWDQDAIEAIGIVVPPPNPLGLSNANFSLNQPGKLVFAWFDPIALGATIPDTTIFGIKFKVLTNDSSFNSVRLNTDNIFPNEVVQDMNALAIPLQVGGIYANSPAPAVLQINNLCATLSGNCNNPSGSISGNVSGVIGPLYYSWTGPNGFTADSFNIANLYPGEYLLEVTSDSGAVAKVQLINYAFNLPQISSEVIPTSCSHDDGCIHLSVITDQLPVSYEWSSPGLSGKDVCDLTPGTYTVTATDAGGCFLVQSFEIDSTDALLVDIPSTPANCVNSQLGTALSLPQNGVAPYQYLWSTADNSQLLTGLFSGLYELTVTDATGCSGTAQAYIADATILSWDLYLQATCAGGNGQGNVQLFAGNPAALEFPITLNWQNGSTQIVTAAAGDTLAGLQMLPSGLYGLTVTDASGCGQVLEASLNCFGPAPADSAALVWPGDADNNDAVNHHDLLYLGLAYGTTGPVRDNASISWSGQPATDWAQNTGGNPVNFKNLDTNGDGTINADDTLAITMNWGQVIDPLADNPFAAPQAVPGMGPTPAPALSLPADTLFAGQSVYLPVVLGSADMPADSMHGLAFSISYNPEILQAVYFEPLLSWFGDPANGLISVQRNFPGQNRIDIAISRTDGLPATGFGVIGHTFIIIEDDIFFKKTDNETESGFDSTGTIATTLHVRNIRARTPANTQPEIRPENSKLVIAKTTGIRPVQSGADKIRLSPNPVSEVLRISCLETPIRSVTVLNMWGQVQTVQTEINSNSINIPVQGWPQGAYLAQVLTNRGIAVQLFICR